MEAEKPFTEQAPVLTQIFGDNLKIIRHTQDGFHTRTGIAYFDPIRDWLQGKAFVKLSSAPNQAGEVEIDEKNHDYLRSILGDIIPKAVFLESEVNGRPGFVVLAEFLRAAKSLSRDKNNPRLIDLYGKNNLVITKEGHVRYVDTSRVFFYEDLPYIVDMPQREEEAYKRILEECKRGHDEVRKIFCDVLHKRRKEKSG